MVNHFSIYLYLIFSLQTLTSVDRYLPGLENLMRATVLSSEYLDCSTHFCYL